MELDGDGIAERDLSGVAEDVPGGVGGDGVTAFEDTQRAALIELQAKAIEAFALGTEQALGAHAEFSTAAFHAQTERGDLYAKIKSDNSEVSCSEAFARFFKLRAQAEREARGHLVGALALLTEQIQRAAEAASR